jgi:hypothetical protein
MPINAFVVGLDLGQMQDYTALCILEKVYFDSVDSYHLRHLQRFPLRTTYPDIVAAVQALMQSPDLGENKRLVVDKTGVGAPVIDMLHQARLFPYAVSIHGGDAVHRDDRELRIPKRDLVSTLQVLFQTKKLKVAQNLPHADDFIQELLNFKVKISLSGHDSYLPWRENTHDDLVLSVSLAAWVAKNLLDLAPIAPPIYIYRESRGFNFKGAY